MFYICRVYKSNVEKMHLTNAEEQIMKLLWRLDKAFIRDLLNEFPEPKPAATTVLTLLKRMIDKGFVSYKLYGNSREYYPLIKKTDYFSDHINVLIKDFFNNSTAQFASFFTNETDMNQEELKELRDLVDKKIKSKTSKK
jgi:BlaI family transcriptional regulator, penicillinase repressor